MGKKLVHFFTYNNAVPIALGIIVLGATGTYAATHPEAIYSESQKIVSIDNTYIANKDLSSYTPVVVAPVPVVVVVPQGEVAGAATVAAPPGTPLAPSPASATTAEQSFTREEIDQLIQKRIAELLAEGKSQPAAAAGSGEGGEGAPAPEPEPSPIEDPVTE